MRLFLTFLALALALAGCSKAPEPARNVILLSIDTLRADRLGCYGYDRPTTPNLDALAARGARFERAYAESPWTLPSHMTMLTGRYPGAHGAVGPMNRALPEIATLAETLRRAGFRTYSYNGGGNLRWRVGFNRGFDVYDDVDNELPETIEKARAILDDLGDDERLFLFLHTFGVHCPYHPPEVHVEKFRSWADEDELPGMRHCGSWIQRWQKRTGKRLSPGQRRFLSDMYDAAVYTVDRQLSSLIEYLDEKKFFEDSVLIVVSDHGESFGKDFRIGHKGQMNIEVLRVPLIIVGRNVPQGVVSTTVGLVDLVPTIWDMVGIEPRSAVDGRSLVSLLTRERDESVTRAQFAETDYGKILRSVVKDSHHLIWDLVEDERRYYDLHNDPLEQNPLPLDEQGRELNRTLERYVESLIEMRRARVEGTGNPGEMALPRAELSAAEEERLRSLGYLE